jgi:hypothetical protein
MYKHPAATSHLLIADCHSGVTVSRMTMNAKNGRCGPSPTGKTSGAS